MDKKFDGFEIGQCLRDIQSVEADLRGLTANLTECQFQAPPRTGGWSIAYCIEHLILTGNAFMNEWDAALEAASSKGSRGNGPFPYSWLQRKLLDFAEPPYLVRVKTTKPFEPLARRPMADTINRFLRMHKEMAARVARSQGLDAGRIKVKSPFVSWLSYPLGMSFELALAHERRHLWQARQIRKSFDEVLAPVAAR